MVAVAPDGTFVDKCLFWLDQGNAVGQIEPIRTHPEYRRRRLGWTLVHEGLHRMGQLGAAVAYVRPKDASPDLVQFYENCGFRVSRRDYLYFRPE